MTDLISRADAIKTIHRYKHRLEGRGQTYGFLLEEFENRIPSAEAIGANLINRHDATTVIREECEKCNNLINADLLGRILALPTSRQTDCTEFIMWLVEVVLDDGDWELNAVAYGEIIARKLKKLGLLEVKDGYYIRPSAEAEWIPCSERLPKENEYVGNVCKYYLIQDEYGDMHVAHLGSRGWETIESVKALGCDVIAWMPLPKPYKGGDTE